MKTIRRILNVLIIILVHTNITAQDLKQNIDLIQVNSEEFQQIISQNNGVLLDVRTKSEFEAEHIENSGQLNYYALDFKKKLELLPKDQAIYLYCNTGYRSQKAGEYLLKKGYTNVYNLEHGIMEWNLSDFPVIEGDKSHSDKSNMMSVDEFLKLKASESTVFIDFYAPWCAPCRKMMLMIDSLKTEYHGKIEIIKVNADVSKKLIKELQLIGVPYFALYRNNNLLFDKSGTMTRTEITKLFDKHIKNEEESRHMKQDQNEDNTEQDNNNFKEPLKVGTIAPNFSGIDHKGNNLELKKLLKSGPVVLIFYRGQWCPVCNKHLANLQEGLEEVKAKGAKIIAVTPEKFEFVDKTISKTAITFPVIYDENYTIIKAYRADFIPKKKTTMKYNTFLNANLKTAQSDDSQTLPVPATYIIGTDGKIKFVHFDPNYKIRAGIDEILKNL